MHESAARTSQEINRSIRSLRKWRTTHADRIYEQNVTTLRQTQDDTPVWIVWSRLQMVGCCLGRIGLLDIASAEREKGWAKCHLAYKYSLYGSILQFIDFPRLRGIQGRKWTYNPSINQTACLLLHSIVLNRTKDADVLARILSLAFDNGWATDAYLRKNPIPRFAVALHQTLAGGTTGIHNATDINCYQDPFNPKPDPEKAVKLLFDMCEFRLSHMIDTDTDETDVTMAFNESYELFSVEVCAFMKWLRQIGIDSPETAHPYIGTEWANPILTNIIDDDVLRSLAPMLKVLAERNDLYKEINMHLF